jgi:DNA-binding NarL/FixJ family response regulator
MHTARHLPEGAWPPLPDERVLIVDLPRVLRDIIRRCFDAERGIELVGETVGDVDLPELVHATRADVVVMGLEEARLPAMGERLLAEHPGVRLLGVAADGRESVLYELRQHRRSLGEVSPSALVTAVRGGDEADGMELNA